MNWCEGCQELTGQCGVNIQTWTSPKSAVDLKQASYPCWASVSSSDEWGQGTDCLTQRPLQSRQSKSPHV